MMLNDVYFTTQTRTREIRVDTERDDDRMNRFSGVGTRGVLVSQCRRVSQGHEAPWHREKKKIGKHLEETEQNKKIAYLNEYLPPKYKLFFKDMVETF